MHRAASPEALLRAAVARLSQAASGFLAPSETGVLPLGHPRRDELRFAALHVLSLLTPSDGARAALEAATGERAATAVAVLEALEPADLPVPARVALATVVADLHSQLASMGDVDVTRALLDATPVGVPLAALVFDSDPVSLDPDAQVSYCQAAQRLESAAHARLGAGLVAFAGNNPRHTLYWVEDDEYALMDVRSSELAGALSWSGAKARSALDVARVVAVDLEGVSEAAASGAVQPAALAAIAEGVQVLTASIDAELVRARAALRADSDSGPDIADRVWELSNAREDLVQRYDATVRHFAVEHTPAETKRKVRDTLARLDPEGFEARRAKAREVQSGVELRALPDAMAMLTAVMPAEHATACYRSIDGLARDPEGSDSEAPVGVRRSDALLALCAQGLSAPARAEAASAGAQAADEGPGVDAVRAQDARISAHVDLIMTLDAFLGLAETPAECVGSGPIPAQDARNLLADATCVTIRRVLVEERTGRPLDAGVRRYQLTDAEREFIFLRDRTCRHPGCGQPAYRCDADHALPYDEGGPTRTRNLGALCRRHHQEKTHGGWTIEESEDDGSCTFVSPLGRRYSHLPEPLLPWAWEEEPPPDGAS